MLNCRIALCLAAMLRCLLCCFLLTALPRAAQAYVIIAGAGGNGVNNVPGGAGGSAIVTIPGHFIGIPGENIIMGGGQGGNSGVGPLAVGGAGGNAHLYILGNLEFSSQGTIRGGNGGNSDNSVPGGNGGTVVLRAEMATFSRTLTIASGTNGWGNSPAFAGRGGAVSFMVKTLKAPTINLDRNDGALIFDVGLLDVSAGNTELDFAGTLPTEVNIGRVALSGGSALTMNSSRNGAGSFGILDVTGAGGSLAGNFVPAFSDVNLAGGAMLTSANPLNFSTLRVLGPGAAYNGMISAGGRDVFFVLDGVPSGSTLLAVNKPGPSVFMDINNAALHFFHVPRGRPFPTPGYTLTLIDGKTGLPPRGTLEARQGLTLRHIFDLDATGNALIAAYRATAAHPQTKALSEGRAAGHALLNQGSDLITGPGMAGILAQDSAKGGLVPFAVGAGGFSRYNTGSYADVEGFSVNTGLAWRKSLDGNGSNFLIGAFFEAGQGTYDAYNSFTDYASVKSNGDTSYYGGGVLARYGTACGVYADASFRAGRVKTDFASNDLRDPISGQQADYDSSSSYYGAHAGLGYVWKITEKASLDFSTRYIWTRQNGDSVNVAGDPVRFDTANSHRWRTGARVAYAVHERVVPYLGAYYEYEFDGRAKASTYGFSIDAPSLKGGTVMGELGLGVKPVAGYPFLLDLSVQGYTGVRDGVSGSLRLKYEF